MNTNSDAPSYQFQKSIFPDYVRITTANAIISAQYLERVLNAICLVLKTKGLRFNIDDFMSGDSKKTRQTLGMIQRQLNETELFKPSFIERLSQFTQRRNRVVHGLFADTFLSQDEISIECHKALKYVEECEWIAKEASDLVEVSFGIYHALGNILLADHPDTNQLTELVMQFGEFRELGLGVIASNLTAHSIEQRWSNQD